MDSRHLWKHILAVVTRIQSKHRRLYQSMSLPCYPGLQIQEPFMVENSSNSRTAHTYCSMSGGPWYSLCVKFFVYNHPQWLASHNHKWYNFPTHSSQRIKSRKKLKSSLFSLEFIMDENGRNFSFMILLENANIYLVSRKLRCNLSFWSLVESYLTPLRV